MGEVAVTCALWYLRYGAVDFSLHRTERDAARSAIRMQDDGEGSPVGVQFDDGRVLRVDEWPAYRAAEEEEARLAAEAAAKPRPPTRVIRDPFEGRQLTILASEPQWVGAGTDG